MEITVNGERPKPYVATMADFKRFLAKSGATVRGLYHWRQDAMTPAARETFFAPRTVKVLQTNGVFWNTGAWLPFGKASEWSFGCDAGQPIAQWMQGSGDVGLTFALSYA